MIANLTYTSKGLYASIQVRFKLMYLLDLRVTSLYTKGPLLSSQCPD